MANDNSKILDNNILLLISVVIFQFLSLLWQQDNPKIISLYNPLIVFVFVYSVYLGYKQRVSKNCFVILKKLAMLILAIVISTILHAGYYAYFIAGGDFYTEFNLGAGYEFIVLGFIIILILPLYLIGIVLGYLISAVAWH